MEVKPLFEMQPMKKDKNELVMFRCVLCNEEYDTTKIADHAVNKHGKREFVVTNITRALYGRK